MNYTYLLINAAMAAPVLLSSLIPIFPKLEWKLLARALPSIAAPFILWDIWATATGHWAFSASHTLGFQLAGLPIEEILFFFTAPLGCWYVLSATTLYVKKSLITLPAAPFLVAGIICTALSLVLWDAQYTSFVLFLSAAVFFASWWKSKKEVWSIPISLLWYYGICFALFFVFNSILTAVPVVTYAESFVTGIRIGTIPIEDFLYNFLLVSSVVFMQQKVKEN